MKVSRVCSVRVLLGLAAFEASAQRADCEPAEDAPGVPEQFEIGRPYSHPAGAKLTLPITGRSAEPVTIELFDALGRRVSVVEAAEGSVRLDVSELAAGVYVLRAGADGRMWTMPIVIRR
jgi:hypothetical protein